MSAYRFYTLGAFLARRFSLPTARRGAAAVGRLTCFLQARTRKTLLRNLRNAFGEEMSERALRRLRLDIYENFGVFVLDFLRLPDIDRRTFREILTPSSWEQYERVLELARSGRPTIIFTGHLGNWEMAAAAGASHGLPLVVLADEHPSPQVTRFFTERREGRGETVVSVHDFHRCFLALKRGDVVAIVGDRPVTGHGITIDFFGRPTLVPEGYALLARRLDARIVPGFMIMNEQGLYDMTFEDPIVPRRTDDEEGDIRDTVVRCMDIVERYARRYPDQWYVFKPVWPPPRRAGGRPNSRERGSRKT
jgi:KDO2-lipid IV(A) lauroyltransferase